VQPGKALSDMCCKSNKMTISPLDFSFLEFIIPSYVLLRFGITGNAILTDMKN
jgi:hypothetical protein